MDAKIKTVETIEVEVTEIFKKCQAEGVQLALVDGNLDVSFDTDVSDELVAMLRANKADILAFIEQQQNSTKKHSSIIKPWQREGALPLSYAQQRLWFIDNMEGGSAHYNMPTALKISGQFDVSAAEQAISQIIERHEPLRTVFSETEQGPQQHIRQQFEFTLTVHDLTELTEKEQNQQVLGLRQSDVDKAFDLSQDLMLRSSFVKLSDNPGQVEGILLLNMHHIASDGWSVQVLVAEFMAIFHAIVSHTQAEVLPLEVQYIDFAHWQRQAMDGGTWEEQLSFWQHYLNDIPQLHNLPLDYVRPTVQGYEAACLEQKITTELYQPLSNFANGQNVSLFMLLQSAFALLLSRFSGEQDIVMGVPSSGRTEPNLEPLIGFFINLLTFRTDLSANPTFKQLLEQTKGNSTNIFANQDVPYELVIEKLNPDRSLAFNPVCQVKFMLLPEPTELPDLSGVTMSPIEPVNQKVRFDLDLSITESSDGMSLAWTYKKELFSEATIALMSQSFEHLLAQLLLDSDKPVAQYTLVDECSQQQLLSLGQGPSQHWDGDNVVSTFETQARQTPEAIAIVQGDFQLSYQQLNEKANRLAHCLLEQELDERSFVAVYLAQSPALMIAVLAVLKAGYAYIPLDPVHSRARLDDILEDAEVEVVLSNEASLNDIAAGNVDLLTVDDWQDLEWLNEYASDNVEGEYSPSSNAYLLYTSGSTGKPKGVRVSHAGLFDYCLFGANRYYTKDCLGSLLVGSHAFDISVPSLFVPLLTGGLVRIPQVAGDLTDIAELLLQDSGNYLLRMTPMHALALLDLLPKGWHCSAAHVFVVGGEQFLVALAKRLQSTFNVAQIYNHYGPSEAVVGCAMFNVTNNIEQLQGCVPIGQAMDNHQLYVLDDNGQLLPKMLDGELYIAGAGVVQGYLNRDELTEQVFIDNPFGPGKMYKTGDRVRWNNQEALEFVSRADNQVKIRGYRIEPDDVRKHIQQLPQLSSASVVVKQDKLGLDILIAYVVAAVEYVSQSEFIAQLKSDIKGQLPEYMCPSAFVLIETLPLNANGKINYSALPEPEFMAQSSYVAPTSDAEKSMVQLWQDLLQLEQVGISDSFFELGGHSLLATRLIGQVRERFGAELTLKEVFANPTIEGLTQKLDEQVERALPLIAKAPAGVASLSNAQQRLWFIRQLQEDDSQYNMPGIFALEGDLSVAALKTAITTIIERHEILRTQILTVDGQPQTQVQTQFELPLNLIDLSSLVATEYDDKVEQLARQDALQPFDLAVDLMLRLSLIKRSNREHVLLLNMHHIASDGWSINILINEFAQIYNALCTQKDVELAPLAIQYNDYAYWQSTLVQGEFLEHQLNYWAEHLNHLPQVHQLPLSRMRSKDSAGNEKALLQALDQQLSAQIKAYCHAKGVTLHMFMLSAFALLLSRYSNETDIVIGTASSGRVDAALDPLIGFFVNDLVFRTEVSPQQSFAEHLSQAKQTLLSAHEHQHVSFEQLVELINPVRQVNLHPLYQVKLDMRNHVSESRQLHQLALSPINKNFAKAKYDLYLAVDDLSDTLQINWLYNDQLFEAQSIETMLSSFNCLLQSLIAKPAAAVNSLSLIDEKTKQDMLSGLVLDETGKVSSEQCLHQWFERQAELTPDSPALLAMDEHKNSQMMSYGQLNQQANRLARVLQSQGVENETLVGLAVSRTCEMVISILAILKAGGAYVPLDPSNPKERLQYIVEDTQLKLLLTESAIDEALDLPGQHCKLLLGSAQVNQLLAEQSDENLSTLSGFQQRLAYIIYTSGSTGKPKGVMQTHANVVDLFKATEQCFDFNHRDVWTLFHSIAFDFSVWELWGALLYGGKLIVPSLSLVKDTHAFVELCREHKVSVLNQTPGAFLSFSQVALQQPKLDDLRFVVFGGEALSIENLLPWWQQYDENQPKLINMYGITETTVHVTFKHVTQADLGCSAIGKGLAGFKLYLLDAQMQPVPFGVVGELYVGGARLAKGYWQREELTAERFVQNPFCPTERLYRTGDLMRCLGNSELSYVGRCDTQVKVRGFRIELGEIEQCLLQQQNVSACLVLVQQDAGGQNMLVAYIDGHNGTDIDELKSYMASKLPYYMCPAGYVEIDQWPLTGNGKIDKAALPQLAFVSQAQYQAPTTDTEHQLVAIWAELLQLDAEQVSTQASFFDLGGHSLLATQLVGAIASQLDLSLTVRSLFEHPTIKALAVVLDSLPQQSSAKITAANRERNPLSFAQQRFWFIDQMAQGAQHYNTASTFDINGRIDSDAITQAVQLMMDRHDILRTNFVREGDDVYQQVNSQCPVPVEFISMSALDEQQQKVKRLAVASAQQVFDLSDGPLFRIDVVSLSQSKHVMMVCMHHIICDGWSMSLMIEEFSSLYSTLVNKQSVAIPALELQYGDYALWQRERFDNGELNHELNYWQSKLKGLPECHALPLKTPHCVQQSFTGKLFDQVLDAELTQQLKAHCKSNNVTLFMLLHSVFAVLLHKYSEERDIVMGTPIAGRVRPEFEPLIGCFLNTLVLRAQIDTQQSFADLLQQQKDTVIDAFEHQQIPFEVLVETLKPQRSSSYNPLCQVKFVLQNFKQSDFALPDMQLTGADYAEHDRVRFDLDLTATEGADCVALSWNYKVDLFDPQTVADMASSFELLLRTVLQNEQTSIAQLNVLSEQQTEQLLRLGCGKANMPSTPYSLIDLFEQQAKKTPDAVAVSASGQTLSYRQLAHKVACFAGFLIEEEVTVGDAVAVCLGRSIELLIANLAVLKAGGRYIPIDPEFNTQRIEHILADAKVSAILSLSEHSDCFSSSGADLIVLDDAVVDDDWLEGCDEQSWQSLCMDSVAYTIYTSGSTGKPKGVEITHLGLSDYCQYALNGYYHQDLDGSLVVTSPGFDITLPGLYLPLLAGDSVEMLSGQNSLDNLLQRLPQQPERRCLIRITPSYLKVVLDRFDLALIGEQAHTFVIGGEALTGELVSMLAQQFPNAKIYNHYGPTEAVVGCCINPIDTDLNTTAGSLPIGRAMDNTSLLVLSSDMRLLPKGVPGELFVAGPCVAKGYANLPQLTEQKFVASNWSLPYGQRLYRTGDVVRWTAENLLTFCGRIDNQVKINGFRVELSQIKSLIDAVDFVTDAVVGINTGQSDDSHYLSAYIAIADYQNQQNQDDWHERQQLLIKQIKTHLSHELPTYLVPAAFVFMAKLPLNDNAKVDMSALTTMAQVRQHHGEITQPRNSSEQILQSIWQSLLGIETIGVMDNFFDLGGHSLLVFQLINQVQSQFKVEISVRDVFEHRTLEALAACIAAQADSRQLSAALFENDDEDMEEFEL